MAESVLPQDFLDYKQRNPDFFPEDQPIEKQLAYFKALDANLRQQHHDSIDGKKKMLSALDNAVEAKNNPKPPAAPQKKAAVDRTNGEKIPEYIEQPRGWFERDGHLYFEVIDTSNEQPVYSYAVMLQNKLTFVDDITVEKPHLDSKGNVLMSGKKYIPRALPLNKDGQPIMIVGLTEKSNLINSTDTTIERIKETMTAHVLKYCELSHNDLELCIFYALSTWFYPKLNTVPYLRFRADTGKGKSRILKVVSELCFLPVKAGGASTAAGTIRFQEYWHGTLVIDEADIKGEATDNGYTNDTIKYLNLGFEKGQYFIKSDKIDPKLQEIFDPFSPKTIAMRGVFQDPATEGRCLSVSPPETERKDIPAILPAEYDVSAAKIRAMLTYYMLTHWDLVSTADPYPDFNDVECEHRLKQLGGPLAKVLSKILPDGLVLFKHYIARRQVEIKEDRAASFVGSVVNLLYDRAMEQDYVLAGTIAEELSTTTTKVSRTLKDAGIIIEPKRVSITVTNPNQAPKIVSQTKKLLVVKSARDWREVVRRYIVTKNHQNVLSNDLVACPVSIRSSEYLEN